jgi:hypothetical protein
LASKNTNPLASLTSDFPPLTDPFYIFGQLFSVLASENAGLLASLASGEKNVSTPLGKMMQNGFQANENDDTAKSLKTIQSHCTELSRHTRYSNFQQNGK